MASGDIDTIGRVDELARIEAALDALDAGDPGCLAITGEPGIGKTHLLREFRRRAEERGSVVLSGTGSEFERDMPYGLFVDALDSFLEAHEIVENDRLTPEVTAELAEILPALAGRRTGHSPSTADDRYRSHRAVRSLLETLAERKPLVLMLDDVQWCDQASTDLVAALARRRTEAPVLLALGFRSGTTPASLDAALVAGDATIVTLPALTERECAELAGDEAAEAIRSALFRDSGGNPFYALQLAHTTPRAGQTQHVMAGVPSAVAASLLGELAALPEPARGLLEAASIAGDPFEPELAYAIADLSTDDGLALLDDLLDAALVKSTDVPRRFAFRHPLVRRAVYEGTKGGWRLAAHGRAATALAAAGASASARAHHVEQSAPQGDLGAIDLLLEAAEASAPRAPKTAAHWFAAALRLLPDSARAERLRILGRLAHAQGATGDLEDCRATLEQALQMVDSADATTRAGLLSALAGVENFLGRQVQARRRLTQALENMQSRDSQEGVKALLDLATGAFFAADIELMREYALQAVACARALGDPALLGAATATLAQAGAVSGHIEEAEASRAEATTLLGELDDETLAQQLEAADMLGWANYYLDRYDDALEWLDRAVAVALATGQAQFLPLMREIQALCAMMRGRLVDAAQFSEEAIETARLTGNPFMIATALVAASQIDSPIGNADAALAEADEAAALAAGLDNGILVALAAASRAQALVEAGDLASDPEELVTAAGGPELPLLPPAWRAIYQEMLTRAQIARGRMEKAEACATRAESAAAELGLPLPTALARRARAAMHLATGDPRAAAEAALSSAEAATEARTPITVARSQTAAGAAFAAAGEKERAIEVLREAERTADECDAAIARSEARRQLRKLGVRVEPRGRASGADSGLASLSVREREVAELVAARKTNKEIAAALFLSEKTIESHLRNIFVKLGASSRVDVARQVERDIPG